MATVTEFPSSRLFIAAQQTENLNAACHIWQWFLKEMWGCASETSLRIRYYQLLKLLRGDSFILCAEAVKM